jgi:hypothetical protein
MSIACWAWWFLQMIEAAKTAVLLRKVKQNRSSLLTSRDFADLLITNMQRDRLNSLRLSLALLGLGSFVRS